MKYVKKPIVVNATQVSAADLPLHPGVSFGWPKEENNTSPHPFDGKHWVRTANGPVVVEAGDYLLEELQGGGYYPCKPGIFEATYTRCEEEEEPRG